jgi:hypothetical protein
MYSVLCITKYNVVPDLFTENEFIFADILLFAHRL